jgi:hypothetical protein
MSFSEALTSNFPNPNNTWKNVSFNNVDLISITGPGGATGAVLNAPITISGSSNLSQLNPLLTINNNNQLANTIFNGIVIKSADRDAILQLGVQNSTSETYITSTNQLNLSPDISINGFQTSGTPLLTIQNNNTTPNLINGGISIKTADGVGNLNLNILNTSNSSTISGNNNLTVTGNNFLNLSTNTNTATINISPNNNPAITCTTVSTQPTTIIQNLQFPNILPNPLTLNTLNFYSADDVTINWEGPGPSGVATSIVHCTRIGRVVTLYFDQLTQAYQGTPRQYTSGTNALPVQYLLASGHVPTYCIFPADLNSMLVSTTTTITLDQGGQLETNFNYSGATTGQNVGWYTFSMTYSL